VEIRCRGLARVVFEMLRDVGDQRVVAANDV
jgi:hypothetical protein